jgi:hypothetical protein
MLCGGGGGGGLLGYETSNQQKLTVPFPQQKMGITLIAQGQLFNTNFLIAPQLFERRWVQNLTISLLRSFFARQELILKRTLGPWYYGKKREEIIWSARCFLFRAEGCSCNLDAIHLLRKFTVVQEPSVQIGSAWKWYYCIGLEKDINSYRLLILKFQFWKFWKDFEVVSHFVQKLIQPPAC